MQDANPVLTAIRLNRGLASALGRGLGITRSAVSQWTRVPAEHALKVAKLMKLEPYMVRPDLYEPPKRKQKRRPQ